MKKREGRIGYAGNTVLHISEFEGEVELTFNFEGTMYALSMDTDTFEALETLPGQATKRVGGLIA